MFRRLALFAFVLFLAGCGEDPGRAFLDSRTPPALGPRFWPPDGWTWGVIEVEGAPEIRYGVAAPSQPPRGHVVLVPGYGESAEVYFETARDLIGMEYAVWVLEPHGQAGSGRFWGERDVGRSAGFDKDALALRRLVEQVIRPRAEETLALGGHGAGALPVLLAVQGGLRHVDGVFLSWPDLDVDREADRARRLTRFGGGFLRARGGPWRRPDADLSRRPTLPLAWQTANPDLRLGGPSWSWIDAKSRAARQATTRAALSKLQMQVVVVTSDRDAAALAACRRIRWCALTGLPGGRPSHLSGSDTDRGVWLAGLEVAVEPVSDDP